MKLERLKDIQFDELMQWAESLENILTPDNLNPTKIKDYPSTIETSERLKRICKWKSEEIESDMQRITDKLLDTIEAAEIVMKYDRVGMPVLKKKYATKERRDRELRFRLDEDEDYKALLLEFQQWKIMYSDWVSHVNKLRRDLRILEVNYQSNGGEGVDL